MSGYDADRLAFFKDKMQEFGQSLESRALHRLSMEYAKKTSPNLSEYPIEFIDPFHWTVMHIVHGEPVKLDIQFSKDYPFSAPQVEIVEPYVFRFNIAGLFGPTKMFAEFLKNIDTYMDRQTKILSSKYNSNTQPSVLEKTRTKLDSNTLESIESAKHADEPLYLIIGTNPKEERKGRTFYDDPHYYMLDYADIKSESNRYFHMDMTEVDVLAYLASELPGRFQIICFDWATMKYIIEYDSTLLYSFFASLKALIQEDGRIYTEPISRDFNFYELHYRTIGNKKYTVDYGSVFSALGLYVKKTTISECLDHDRVLEEVHLKRTEPRLGADSTVAILTKTQLGGKRNYKRQTRRRRRIVYRKKRRTRK